MARSSLSQASLNPRVRGWHADALFERARIASFRHEDDRRRFVTSHALVRLVLSQATGLPATKLRFAAGCPRCGGAHDKPRVEAAPQLHVSISHAADRVAVAATVGLLVAAIAAQLQVTRQVRPARVATLHRS